MACGNYGDFSWYHSNERTDTKNWNKTSRNHSLHMIAAECIKTLLLAYIFGYCRVWIVKMWNVSVWVAYLATLLVTYTVFVFFWPEYSLKVTCSLFVLIITWRVCVFPVMCIYAVDISYGFYGYWLEAWGRVRTSVMPRWNGQSGQQVSEVVVPVHPRMCTVAALYAKCNSYSVSVVMTDIQSVQYLSNGLLVWLSDWGEIQLFAHISSDANATGIISCFIKTQHSLPKPFWCRLVVEIRLLNECRCPPSATSVHLYY